MLPPGVQLSTGFRVYGYKQPRTEQGRGQSSIDHPTSGLMVKLPYLSTTPSPEPKSQVFELENKTLDPNLHHYPYTLHRPPKPTPLLRYLTLCLVSYIYTYKSEVQAEPHGTSTVLAFRTTPNGQGSQKGTATLTS